MTTSSVTAEHSPLPWSWHATSKDQAHTGSIYHLKRPGHAYAIAMQPRYVENDQFSADAAFIVEAVNNHARLKARVIALEQVISEEMYPENCDDDANRMLLESAIDSHRRRVKARLP